MFERKRVNRLGLLLLSLLAAGALAACGSAGGGSSGESAQSLLQQTFGTGHTVKSGVIGIGVVVNPSGSSTVNGPVTLSLGGPFESRGSGHLPSSDFTISLSALGRHGSLSVISTGTNGYITLQGVSYRLPAADFTRLQSSFSGAASTSKGQSTLSSLGIHPLNWLKNPTIVGTETVGGVTTTHIHAQVDVAALIPDLNALLAKTAKTAGTTKLPSSISSATRAKIAAAFENPSVDTWTGRDDKALRKLTLHLTVPVSGQTSSLLGGLHSAGIAFTIQYSDLNQPQTITAPANVHPYSELAAKVQGLTSSLQGSLGGLGLGLGLGSGGSSSQSGSTGSSVPGASELQKYTKCLQQAAGDVKAMQKCQPLLSGG